MYKCSITSDLKSSSSSSACALRALSLGECGALSPTHTDALVAALLSLPQGLDSLVLSDTQLEPDAIVLLGRVIRAGDRGLVHLALDKNPGLGDKGAAALGGGEFIRGAGLFGLLHVFMYSRTSSSFFLQLPRQRSRPGCPLPQHAAESATPMHGACASRAWTCHARIWATRGWGC